MSDNSFFGGLQRDSLLEATLERIEQKLDLLLEHNSENHQSAISSDILDVVDVASICKVTQRTVYNWVCSRKLLSFKANGRLLFRQNEVDDFIARRKRKT